MAGKLDHLKIKKAPAVFASWARQYNQQVSLLENIQGGPGIDARVVHSPRSIVSHSHAHKPKEQPRGKIVLSLRPSAINGIGVGGGGGGNGNSTIANVVGLNGDLLALSVSNVTTTNTYPVRLVAGDVANFNASYVSLQASGGIVLKAANNGNYMFLDITAMLGVLQFKTFVGCNSGAPGNYQTIATDFF